MTPELIPGWGYLTQPAHVQDGRYPVLNTASGGQEG